MNNKEFGKLLEERTKDFAIDIVRLSKRLPYSVENNVLKKQLARSSTSIGANYREANRARSKADFTNKIKICEGEASETIYWLELIEMLDLDNQVTLNDTLTEAREILAIMSSISAKLYDKR